MIVTTTPRLIIRAFNDKDASALFDYLSSPRAPCFYDEKLSSFSEAKEEVNKRAHDAGQFAVCLKETMPCSKKSGWMLRRLGPMTLLHMQRLISCRWHID